MQLELRIASVRRPKTALERPSRPYHPPNNTPMAVSPDRKNEANRIPCKYRDREGYDVRAGIAVKKDPALRCIADTVSRPPDRATQPNKAVRREQCSTSFEGAGLPAATNARRITSHSAAADVRNLEIAISEVGRRTWYLHSYDGGGVRGDDQRA